MNPENITLKPSSEETHCHECNEWDHVVIQVENIYLCMPCAWKMVEEIMFILKGQ